MRRDNKRGMLPPDGALRGLRIGDVKMTNNGFGAVLPIKAHSRSNTHRVAVAMNAPGAVENPNTVVGRTA